MLLSDWRHFYVVAAWLLLLALGFNHEQVHAKFAYVTIHYEGTSRDAEYVLGLRVLIQSIKFSNTNADIVILVSESVSSNTRRILEFDGAIVKDVQNLANPYKNETLWNPNFEFTLNKLYAWRMTEYDKVIFLDADNIILEKMDDLFRCGRFCVVYQNPCHFHTGLIVIKPSESEFVKLNASLYRLTSFDGADQGFLSAYFKDSVFKAPLFTQSYTMPIEEHVSMRLPVGYNLNHKFFYERYDWELYRVHDFDKFRIPGLSLGYPMAPILKPWYWWACFILDLHWEWHRFRDTLIDDDRFVFYNVWLTIKMSFVVGVVFYVISVVSKSKTVRAIRAYARAKNIPPKAEQYLGKVAQVLLILFLMWGAFKSVHPLTPPINAFPTYVLLQHLGMLATIEFYYAGQRIPRLAWIETRVRVRFLLSVSAVLQGFTILISWQAIYSTILHKGLILGILIYLCFTLQIRILEAAGIPYEVKIKKKRVPQKNDSEDSIV